jgi:hypothetical protein
MMLPDVAVLYSGCQLARAVVQFMSVYWNPFAADACMKPDVWRVRSSMTTSKASLPPKAFFTAGAGASNMWMLIRSPGFMMSVFLFGTLVSKSESPGPAGPVGTPLVWMKAELIGSSQSGWQVAYWSVHSRLSMVMAAHQPTSLQLSLSTHGGLPGGYNCISITAEPAPG